LVNSKKLDYSKKIVLKPWGEEYNIFSNQKKFAITYLKIKKNHTTSLHCHPNKKTGFLILSGTANVQLGIYKKNIKKFGPMSILVLREGLFHRISASKNKDLYALEVESPNIKTDLVRMDDDYGRKNKEYEKLDNTKEIKKNDLIFKIPKKKKNYYKLNGVKISLAFYKSFNNFKNFDDKSVSIICDGSIVTNDGKDVIKIGEIVKSFTLKKLSKIYKINKKILILKANKV
jgi:mannose-6-phosphate isomerase-like protein (cupin superfamily)